MNVVAAIPKATVADLLAAPDTNTLELVNGTLVEKKAGVLSGETILPGFRRPVAALYPVETASSL